MNNDHVTNNRTRKVESKKNKKDKVYNSKHLRKTLNNLDNLHNPLPQPQSQKKKIIQ
jgi:hypothetical protein